MCAIYEAPVEDGLSRLELWEQGRSPGSSCTPSSFDETYRAQIVSQIDFLLGPKSSARVLSLGCGNAFIERALLEAGHDVLATDVSRQALAFAQRKGLRTRSLDATVEFPFRGESFDAVISDGVIGHLTDEQRSLRSFFERCRPILKHGGVLFMGNDAPMTGEDIQEHHKLPGLFWFSAQRLGDSLHEAGYKDVNTRLLPYFRPEVGTRDRVLAWGTK
ncbi:MAG TPA: class I SAM-dependent methyltransferase [Candidatus Saccharimonadales bacterium]